MDAASSSVGIAVAQARVEIAVRTRSEQWGWATDAASLDMDTLVSRLPGLPPELLVLEAPGGGEGPTVAALAAAGLPLAVVNPRQVRDRGIARAVGHLAKTAVLDAQILAHFAQVIPPRPVRCPMRRPRSGRRCWHGGGR